MRRLKLKSEKLLIVLLTALLCAFLSGCKDSNNDNDDEEPPATKPREMIEVTVNTVLDDAGKTANFLTKWEEHMYLIVICYDKDGKVINRNQGNPPRLSGDGLSYSSAEWVGSNAATFAGKITKGADSLVAYAFYSGLNNLPFKDITFDADRMYDDLRYIDFTSGSYKGDMENISFTLKHRKSLMNLKVTNKTGRTITYLKLHLRTDESNKAFYGTGMYELLSFPPVEMTCTNAVSVKISDFSVTDGAELTVPFPLWLKNEAVLDGKAFNIVAETNAGTYAVSKTGKKYESGREYDEEMVLETK